MKIKSLLILLTIFLVVSCDEGSTNDYKLVPINQLLTDALNSGAPISTTGYLQKDRASATYNLFPYEEDAINGDLSRAIAVIPLGVVQNLDLASCEQNYVLLKGTFYPASKSNQRQITPVQEMVLVKLGDEKTPNRPCWVNPSRSN